MKHVVGNGNCTVYHSRTFQKSRRGSFNECMLSNDDVHVLAIDLHPDKPRRKRNRVRIQVRLWKSHTPHFQIEKVEKVTPQEIGRDQLILEAGVRLWFFREDVYKYFGMS